MRRAGCWSSRVALVILELKRIELADYLPSLVFRAPAGWRG